jgi:hypothetical protein
MLQVQQKFTAIRSVDLYLNLELSQACLLWCLVYMITGVDHSLMLAPIFVRISKTKFHERFSTWFLT